MKERWTGPVCFKCATHVVIIGWPARKGSLGRALLVGMPFCVSSSVPPLGFVPALLLSGGAVAGVPVFLFSFLLPLDLAISSFSGFVGRRAAHASASRSAWACPPCPWTPTSTSCQARSCTLCLPRTRRQPSRRRTPTPRPTPTQRSSSLRGVP